jgi:hypothetical protein
MLQIIDLEDNELFSDISNQESATVSGGTSTPNLSKVTGIATLGVMIPLVLLTALVPKIMSASMPEVSEVRNTTL